MPARAPGSTQRAAAADSLGTKHQRRTAARGTQEVGTRQVQHGTRCGGGRCMLRQAPGSRRGCRRARRTASNTGPQHQLCLRRSGIGRAGSKSREQAPRSSWRSAWPARRQWTGRRSLSGTRGSVPCPCPPSSCGLPPLTNPAPALCAQAAPTHMHAVRGAALCTQSTPTRARHLRQ